MGISGLLQFIKDAAEPVNVKKYKDQTVAVDTYCWLHKGAFSCAEKLAKGEPTNQYVLYCMKFVDMLLTFGVKPILVFDGRNLPSKHEVEKARRDRREANLQKGKRLLREGKLSEARDCFTRCVNITPAMAHNLIKAARARGVDCVVAPYEADAQLAFLTKSGLAQAVITEDSDLLAFGCKKVILKMDKQGNGLEIDQSNLGRCRSLGNAFTEEKFRYMCILSGCDYLASLHGIGLGKACKLLRLTSDPNIVKVIKKMGHYLKMNIHIPEQYIEGFIRANNTFLYQLVFDPITRKVIPLNPYPEDIDVTKLSYAGHNLGDDKGLQMAIGNLDINTMEKIDDYNPDKAISQHSKSQSRGWDEPPAPTGPSIWSRNLKAQSTASPCSSPSTRGGGGVISRGGVRLPCRELQVKRPRDDSGVSDQDLLVQYSASNQKRPRSNQPVVTPTVIKPRNRFATLLQKRNQEEDEAEKGLATCSRYFSASKLVADVSPKESTQEDSPQQLEACAVSAIQSSSLTSQSSDSQDPDIPSVDTPSPAASPSTTPLSAANRELKLFHWFGNSTSTECLAALQQFQYKETSFSSMRNHKSPGETLPPSLPSIAGKEEKLPDSPLSQDSAYFSQPQPDATSCHKEEKEVPTHKPPPSCHNEINSYDDLEPEQSPTPVADAERKPGMFKSRVSGLSRLKSSRHCQVAKVQTLGPARASGLRKKPEGAGRKISSTNENSPRPGQTTISSLWGKFSFKNERLKHA